MVKLDLFGLLEFLISDDLIAGLLPEVCVSSNARG